MLVSVTLHQNADILTPQVCQSVGRQGLVEILFRTDSILVSVTPHQNADILAQVCQSVGGRLWIKILLRTDSILVSVTLHQKGLHFKPSQ